MNYLKEKYNVGIYLRLSNEDKDKVASNNTSESIKNQRNMLLDYIHKHDELILKDEYCDEDLSGAGTYRPEFERLINDCKNKKIDIVLCKSQSRFSRDMIDVEKYINNLFKEWNIRFISLADNADTNVLGNKKARQINGLVNEWYLEDISNNIRSAFASKMKQGEFISPFAAYGYEIKKDNNNKLVIDQTASKVVKKIFNLYLSGYGYASIAKYLNKKNIPSPSLYKYIKGIKLNVVSKRRREDIKWSGNAVKTILTNELYIGNLTQGKRTTVSYKNHKIIKKDKRFWIKKDNTHESIINKDTFLKVQEEIKRRTKPTKSTGKIHIFSGKVYCLECKSIMRKKNSGKHNYLVCSNIKDGYNVCLNKHSIRYDDLESIILKEINKIVDNYYDENLLKEYIEKDNKYANILLNLKSEKKDIQQKFQKNANYLKELYKDKINNVISLEQFNKLLYSFNTEEKYLNTQLKDICKKIKDCNTIYSSSNYALKLICKYRPIYSLNRRIVDEFIDKIYIGSIDHKQNARDIIIKWNIL